MTVQSLTGAKVPTFDYWSIAHYKILLATAEERGCNCKPYEDWFTFKTWSDLGYQVQKGEHGVKLTTWIVTEKTQADGTKKISKRPKGYSVFCHCQVKSKEAS